MLCLLLPYSAALVCAEGSKMPYQTLRNARVSFFPFLFSSSFFFSFLRTYADVIYLSLRVGGCVRQFVDLEEDRIDENIG